MSQKRGFLSVSENSSYESGYASGFEETERAIQAARKSATVGFGSHVKVIAVLLMAAMFGLGILVGFSLGQ